MKKTIILTVGLLVVLAIAVSAVSAATSSTFPNNLPPWSRYNALTDAQKQELAPLFNQMNDLQKQMFEVQKQVIQKQVEFGNLTQQQAEQIIAWRKQRMESGFGPGMMGRGPGFGPRFGPGFGPRWQQQQQPDNK
jgi:peptidoglycan hydrolase CwlO-like protein